MADTAVAVHPNDKRYADLIGKHVWRPLAREKIPIIADEAIDPEFGTGVLKVTPAHDKLDFRNRPTPQPAGHRRSASRMAKSIVLPFRSWMGSIDSKRARKRPIY